MAAGSATQTPGNANATDLFHRSSAALQAVAAMQAAARATAVAAGSANNLGADPNHPGQTLPDVPDGLVVGGTGPGLRLAVNAQGEPVLLQGANAPTAGTNPNQVTVVQTQQQALLQWQTFDIGKNTTLTFDQSAGGGNVGEWIAFNYVSDPSGRPSQILGSLRTTNGQVDSSGNAEVGGQVYVLNANGIIFGGSSQVNVHSLVASSLPINPNLVSAGLLNDTSNYQFLFSSSDITATGQKTAAGTDAFGDASTSPNYVAPPPANGYGSVTVQAGAQLTSPSSSDNVGGAIILVAPNVSNAGTISTPDGQTILAAGLQVGLTAHDNNDPTRSGVEVTNGVQSVTVAGSATDPSLRGLDAYVGAVVEPGVNTTQSSQPNYTPLQYVTASDGSAGFSSSAWNGVVTNQSGSGLIQAPRGDVTLVGAIVNQMGIIESSTSVSLNGRIDLLASYGSVVLGSSSSGGEFEPFTQEATGLVNFGSSSVTQILTDTSSGTAVGTELTLPSQIYVQAHAIHLEGDGADAGAIVQAPSGYVDMTAGDWLPNPDNALQTLLTRDSGQIYLDAGSAIDVSGSQNVSASVTENIVSEQLRGTELADSPVQRGGPLEGDTIQFDIRQTGTYDGQDWVGTPLAITSGYIGLIERSIGELTTAGGTVNLGAGGSVVLQPGSTVNVSGGWINYAGADVQTTNLIGPNGQIYNIAQATPNLVYSGIYTGTTTTTDSKWGVTQTTANPIPAAVYEPGYVQGGAGGSITITAPSIAPDATLIGFTAAGARQVNAPNATSLAAAVAAGIDPNIWNLSTVPAASRLSLLFQGQAPVPNTTDVLNDSPLPADITISAAAAASAPTLAAFDPNATGALTAAQSTVAINPLLVSSANPGPSTVSAGGFGTLNIEDSDGTISVPAATGTAAVLALPAGGELTLTAGSIDIEGGISAPGGTINLLAYDVSPYATEAALLTQGTSQSYSSSRGDLTLGAAAFLDVSGSIVDQRDGSDAATPLFAGGGSVVIKANQVNLEAGSVINVSGGVTESAAGSPSFGKGGSLVIASGQDPFGGTEVINTDGTANTAAIAAAATDSVLGGGLVMAGTVEGYSGGHGGTLSVQAPAIQIGGSAADASLGSGALWLPSSSGNVPFFSEGGFATFNLTGLGQATNVSGTASYSPGLVIESGTTIHPVVESWTLDSSAAELALDPAALAAGIRPAVSLGFFTPGARNLLIPSSSSNLVVRGDLVMEAGSSIVLDPVGNAASPTPATSAEGSVTFKGDTVDIEGSVRVPGGTITVAGGASLPEVGVTTQVFPTVVLGANATLNTSGETVLVEDAFGHSPGDAAYLATGSVLGGGAITVQGNIVAQPGALLEANGAAGALVLASGYSESSSAGPTVGTFGASVSTPVDTSGGAITLAASQELFSAATYEAFAGNSADPKSAGGSLSVSGSYYDPFSAVQTPDQVVLTVTATPAAFSYSGGFAVGNSVLVNGVPAALGFDASNTVIASLVTIDAASINAGGFSSVALQGPSAASGAVRFVGDVAVNASGALAVANSGVIVGDGNISLTAPYVQLGQSFAAPSVVAASTLSDGGAFTAPTYGTGSLSVVATQLVDVGNLSLQGIGTASLNAGSGAIRGDGTFDVAGNISLTAGQIYPPSAVAFTIAAYPYPSSSSGSAVGGTVTISAPAGPTPQLPLSAGGVLSIYASTITQGGTLEAPYGQINLGSSTSIQDPLTLGGVFPSTSTVTLASGSVTSTSGTLNALLEPATTTAEPIPYGLNVNGTEWIDPAGTNISVTGNGYLGNGLPSQAVNLTAPNINIQGASGTLAAAQINVAGGGDLLAYQFIPGTGGTKDVLAPSTGQTSFAVIPGFSAAYAPYAPYGLENSSANTLSDGGYVGSAAVGSEVYLNAGSGLPAGIYTVLPARYALLPGAYLVTPVSGAPAGSAAQPDGSVVTSGYTLNAFTGGAIGSPLLSYFDVASKAVVQKQAEYTVYSANTFFAAQAVAQGVATPRLPADSGLLALSASSTIDLEGTVDGTSATGGRGSLVEISGPAGDAIEINSTGAGTDADTFYLNASQLSSFGAEGLLIGGLLTSSSTGSSVAVNTSSITVDSGAVLSAEDLVLAANQDLTVQSGATVEERGSQVSSVGTLEFGQVDSSGNTVVAGDGVVLRVSSDPTAQISRVAVTPFATSSSSGNAPTLSVASGAQILGGTGSVNLNSTSVTQLGSSATVSGSTVDIGSGQIALQLDPSLAPASGSSALVLSSTTLHSLLTSASSLSLLSYSSLDTYGAGSLGALSASGAPELATLALHAGEIRGFEPGSGVSFNAQTITLDNSPSVAGPGPSAGAQGLSGTVTFNAGTIRLGSVLTDATSNAALNNGLDIDQFQSVALVASKGVLLAGSGGLNPGLAAQGSLSVQAPFIYAATGANQTLSAGGAISVLAPATALATQPTLGLGSTLALQGTSLSLAAGTSLLLPSGTVSLEATSGNLTLGGTVSTDGLAKTLSDSTTYTNGGQINLTADAGSIIFAAGSDTSVNAPAAGGNAGTLSISAPLGGLKVAGSVEGNKGLGGLGGVASIDIYGLQDQSGNATSLLSNLENALVKGGFVQSQDIRVRNGDVVVDGTATAANFDLSADQGSIEVSGTIDASGPTGGTIALAASGSVTVDAGAELNVHGENFNSAGQGGSVTLSAGTSQFDSTGNYLPNSSAYVTVSPGSTIDLSIANALPLQLNVSGQSSVTVLSGQSIYFPAGTPGDDEVTFGAPGTLTSASGTQTTFAAGFTTALPLGSTVVLSGGSPGTVSFAASGTGGSIPLSVASSASLASTTNVTDLTAFNFTGTLLLRAPQILQNGVPVDVQIQPIAGTLVAPSSVIAEGYQVFEPAGGSIDAAEAEVQLNGAEFAGGLDATGMLHAGNTAAIVARLTSTWTAGQPNGSLSTVPDDLVHVQPGAEIDNPSGALTLENSWELSSLRFGPNATDPMSGAAIVGAGEPGVLTLRAAGNIIFDYNSAAANTSLGGTLTGGFASLSDGFGGVAPTTENPTTPYGLWTETLLPAGSRSWSYQIVAGADLTAADVNRVQPLAVLQAADEGSVQLGNLNEPSISQSTADLGRGYVVPQYYQVIRTGTGSIDIASGLDLQSLNPEATFYTAGQQAPDLAGFAAPDLAYNANPSVGAAQTPVYPAQYSFDGGNVSITAQRDIIQDDVVNGQAVVGTSEEMPTNWLYRQGYVDANGNFDTVASGYQLIRGTEKPNRPGTPNVASTSWWIDFSNYFEGVGALGGGNVTLTAGRDITNIDAVVPTNARAPGIDPVTGNLVAAADAQLLELGGGDLSVQAGRDISGGVYYVERGTGSLVAGDQILTNAARTYLNTEEVAGFPSGSAPDPSTWLPTTLFLGDGTFDVTAGGSVDLGPVANPFLLPQGINNSYWEKTYFSTYATDSGVQATSLTGNVTLQDNAFNQGASLYTWYSSLLLYTNGGSYSDSVAEPWLRLAESSVNEFDGGTLFSPSTGGEGVFGLMPPTLQVAALNGNVNIVGNLTLAPSAVGNLAVYAAGSINGLQPNGLTNPTAEYQATVNEFDWNSAVINLSDANPASFPGVASPLSVGTAASGVVAFATSNSTFLDSVNLLFNVSSTDLASTAPLQEKEALHDSSLLHAGDANPLTLDAAGGDLSGITLFSAKTARINAGQDITDIAFYLQNDRSSDISVVSAGRDLIAYDPTAPLVEAAQTPASENTLFGGDLTGDIQVSGPGTLEVLTGRNLTLGVGATGSSTTGIGIASVGNSGNPFLPFAGANIIAAAGVGAASDLTNSSLGFAAFLAQFDDPATAGTNAARYLPEVASLLGVAVTTGESTQAIWNSLLAPYASLSAAGQTQQEDLVGLNTFYDVLKDAGEDQNNPASPNYGSYAQGYAAIADLFPGSVTASSPATAVAAWDGSVSLATREIVTTNGGNISVLAPGGGVVVGNPSDPQKADQGILTEQGGNISIFASNDVEVGTSRIFTLKGGNEIIWSSVGNIAAGSGSKTVFSAPPTRVLVDPQSANVEDDVAGLATGSGIGVLATLVGVAPGNVDLIAPVGTVDAGDAGIRSSGNLSIAALHILNASNIQVSGSTSGIPTVATPNIGALAAASNSAAAAASTSTQIANQQNAAATPTNDVPSIITIEVLGYGGGDLTDLAAPAAKGELSSL